MTALKDFLPSARDVEDAPLADLASAILEVLRTADMSLLNRHNFMLRVGSEYGSYQQGRGADAVQACGEAWSWLVSEGFIYQKDDNCVALTRKAKATPGREGFAQWVASQELPEHMLHPVLLLHARPLFLQGRYDTAVFEAFKTLEVAIRDAAGLGPDSIGVQLASRAFHPEDGPLIDSSSEKGERVALMQLMAGAIGSYKNPHSHRRVDIAATEAREMLLLASHLLRIVEARNSRLNFVP